MQPVEKAIWYIEHSFLGELSLDRIAERAGVSKYHLIRAFSFQTGLSVMRYVRGRRLSEAARLLVDGDDTILSIALDTGYGSHEAFTRAFRDQFGQAPEQVRRARTLCNLDLVEPIRMTQIPRTDLKPPRLTERGSFLVAGLRQHYSAGQMAGIPSQWQRFIPWMGNLDGQQGNTRYGVICGGDDEGNVDYLTGVEVSTIDSLPDGISGLKIAAQSYAVFLHEGHVSQIGQTWMAIFGGALGEAGLRLKRAPQFELVDDRFDAETGTGLIEIWVAIER